MLGVHRIRDFFSPKNRVLLATHNSMWMWTCKIDSYGQQIIISNQEEPIYPKHVILVYFLSQIIISPYLFEDKLAEAVWSMEINIMTWIIIFFGSGDLESGNITPAYFHIADKTMALFQPCNFSM